MFCQNIDEHYKPFGSGLPRSPSLHLTDIIRSLQSSLGLGKVAQGWEMSVCADIGFLWEDAFSLAYRDKWSGMIHRPGELTLDGITGSPDGWGPDPLGKVPFANHELKCTWRSFNRRPEDDFYWMTQFKCYCKMMSAAAGGVPMTVTCLHVFYMVGNYKGSGPKHAHHRFEFEQHEIDTAWGMVVRHAREKGLLK